MSVAGKHGRTLIRLTLSMQNSLLLLWESNMHARIQGAHAFWYSLIPLALQTFFSTLIHTQANPTRLRPAVCSVSGYLLIPVTALPFTMFLPRQSGAHTIRHTSQPGS